MSIKQGNAKTLAMKMKEKCRKNKLYFVSKIKPSKNKATREDRATHRKFKAKKKILLKKIPQLLCENQIVCRGEGVFTLDILKEIQPIITTVCKMCSSEIHD